MEGYPYYSPPPPPPPPPSPHIYCNHSRPPPPPPPPPPPKCNPCPCVCICKLEHPTPRTPAHAPLPHHWPPPPITPIAPGPQLSSGGDNHTVIIAVCVSVGGAFFLAFLAIGLFCLAKKKKKMIPPPAAAPVCIEEHQHVQESITKGPCGDQTVTVTLDDDIRIHEIAEVGAVAAAAVGSHVEPPDHHHHRQPASYAEGHLKTG